MARPPKGLHDVYQKGPDVGLDLAGLGWTGGPEPIPRIDHILG